MVITTMIKPLIATISAVSLFLIPVVFLYPNTSTHSKQVLGGVLGGLVVISGAIVTRMVQ